MPSRRLFASSKTLIKAMPCLVLFRPVSYRSPISATPDIVPHLPIPCDPCTQQQQRQQCTAAASAAMRAAASQTPVLDGPSTSGRCLCSPTLVYTRRRGRIVLAQASHMPIGLHNTQPIPGFRPPTAEGVVKGYRTTATPRLTPERVLQLLAENTPEPAKTHFGSFYSSALGGIVTEPGFMLVSIDDAMVNKGDAVCESVSLSEGYLYQLDARMARFLDSAELAGLPLPFSEERLRRILLDTAAASLKMNGMLTFWLSRGRGGLGLGQSNGTTFYALLSTETCHLEVDRSAGIRAVTTPVDPRSPYFTAMRNVSQIENAVAHYEALARGADLAVFVDSDGTVLYGSNCSIGLLTTDNTLVLPPDEDGLANFGVQELAAHTLEYVKDEDFLTVDRIEQRTFTVQEMLAAQEAFAVSTQIGVIGITHFDDQQIGTHEFEGEAGTVSMALNELLVVERQPKPGSPSPAFTEVPYGYLTGMKSQLV